MDEVDFVSDVDTTATTRREPPSKGGPWVRRKRRKQPARQPVPRAAGSWGDAAPPAGQQLELTLHVLLIEDQRSVAQSLKRQLEGEGIRIDLAADGETGLAMARRRTYDVLLVDRRLPKMSGDQLLEQLRHGGDRTPVVVLTGYPDIDSAFRAGRLHAAEYLQKGTLTAAELAGSVRRAAATSPRVAQHVPLFATDAHETSPCIREVRSCLAHLDALPASASEHADRWRGALAKALVRALGSRQLTFLEFVAGTKALEFLYSPVGSSLDAATRWLDDWLTDFLRRILSPPHTRAQAVVARIEAAGTGWADLSEQQIAQENDVSIADITRWLHEYARLSFQECRRLVVMRSVVLSLTETTDQVKRIAFTVGYQDPSKLDNEFHLAFGLTPTELRRLRSGAG